jgi:hypothetical protein
VSVLSIPAVAIRFVLLVREKGWSFWLGGFLFLGYATHGDWVGCVKQNQFRIPPRWSVVFP